MTAFTIDYRDLIRRPATGRQQVITVTFPHPEPQRENHVVQWSATVPHQVFDTLDDPLVQAVIAEAKERYKRRYSVDDAPEPKVGFSGYDNEYVVLRTRVRRAVSEALEDVGLNCINAPQNCDDEPTTDQLATAAIDAFVEAVKPNLMQAYLHYQGYDDTYEFDDEQRWEVAHWLDRFKKPTP